MATVTVSSSAALLATLKTAAPNTRIELTSGTYTLNARGGQDFHDAVIARAAGAQVNFSSVNLNDVSNLTFNGVDFQQKAGAFKSFVIANSDDITIRNVDIRGTVNDAGYGAGNGLWISKNNGFDLVNSTVSDFKTGLWIQGTRDLHITNNDLNRISLDGMIVGGVHNAYFAGNHVRMHVPQGTKHTDGMQFYNSQVNDPSSTVGIRDNVIETNNKASHGIYMANGIADDTGDPSSFYSDIVIKRNVIVSAQVSGIAVGQVDGVSILGNTILQDTDFRSTRDIDTPVIRVHAASTGVRISDNITHEVPAASGANWFPTRVPEPRWVIVDNALVPVGTALGSVQSSGPDAFPDPDAATPSDSDTFLFGDASDASAAPGSEAPIPEAPVSEAAVAAADDAVQHLVLDHAHL